MRPFPLALIAGAGGGEPPPPPEYEKLRLSMRGDLSDYRHPITFEGTPTLSHESSPLGPVGAVTLNGSTDYLSIPSSSALNLYNKSWCIETYFKQAADMGSGQYVYWAIGSDNNNIITAYVDNKRLTVYIRVGGSTVVTIASDASPGDWDPDATWHHLAVTRDDATDTYKVFLDGLLRDIEVSASQINDSDQPLLIGQYPSVNYKYPGAVGFFRISNVVRYPGAFIPPFEAPEIDDNTMFQYIPDGDNSSLISPLTMYVGANTDTQGFRNRSCFNFPYLAYGLIPHHEDYNLLDKDFYIGFWVRCPSFANQSFISKYHNDTDAQREWEVFTQNDGDLAFTYHDGTSVQEAVWSWSEPTNEWVHIAVTRTGTVLEAFENGVSLGTHAITATIRATTQYLLLAHRDAGTGYLTGKLEDMQILVGTSAGALPPYFPLGTPTPTESLVLNMDGDSANYKEHLISFNGGASIDNVTRRVGNSSLKLDGSDQYAYVATQNTFYIGTHFTVGVWFYPENASGDQMILAHGTDANTRWFLQLYNGNLYFIVRNAGVTDVNLAGSIVINNNQWCHAEVVRDGSNFHLFVNGVLDNTAVFAGSVTAGTADFCIGSDRTLGLTGDFTGRISYVEIWDIARHTAAFIPPYRIPTADDDRKFEWYVEGDNRQAATHEVILRNGAYINKSTKRWGSGFFFDGSNDYVEITDSSELDLTGDFTIAGWIYSTQYSSNFYIATHFEDASNRWFLLFDTLASNGLSLRFNSGSGEQQINQGSVAGWTTNRWHHVAVTKEGDVYTLYRDGLVIGQATNATAFPSDLNGPIYLGTRDTTQYMFSGVMDDFVISRSLLYPGPFSPPEFSYGKELPKSFNFMLNAEQSLVKHPTTIIGTPEFVRDNFVVNECSLKCDGVGDYLTLAYNSVFDVGTGEFSVGMWMYFNTIPVGVIPFYASRQNGTPYVDAYWYSSGGGIDFRTNSDVVFGSWTPEVNRWYYIETTRKDGVGYIFVDGVLITSGSMTDNIGHLGGLNFGRTRDDQSAYLDGNIGLVTVWDAAQNTSAYTPVPEIPVVDDSVLYQFVPNGISGENSGLAMTAMNDPIMDPVHYRQNGSFEFDGTNWVQVPGTEVDLSDGNFTIEFWVRMHSVSPYPTFIGKWNGSYSFRIRIQSTFINVEVSLDGTNYNIANFSVSWPTAQFGSWSHIAVTLKDGKSYIFVDGEELLYQNFSNTPYHNTVPLTIGSDANGTYSLDGEMDEVKVSSLEATRVSRFFPTRYNHVSDALWHMDGAEGSQSFVNTGARASSNHVITAVGGAFLTTADKVFGSAALSLNGTTAYAEVADHPDWHLEDEDFTICTRIKFNSNTGAQPVFGQVIDDDNRVQCNYYNNAIYFFARSSGVTYASYNVSWTPNTDQWYHIAWVRRGSTLSLYIDGVAQSLTVETAIGTMPNIATPLCVGRSRVISAFQYLDGLVDEFRWLKGIGQWDSGFTVPTAPYAGAGQLILHFNGDNLSTDFPDDGVRYPMLPVNDAAITTANFKFGNSSLRLNGSDEAVRTIPELFHGLGADDFTLTAWVYPNTLASTFKIISQYESSTGEISVGFNSSTGLRFDVVDGLPKISVSQGDTVGWTTSTWHHVAVMRNGTKVTLYLNGVEVASVTDTDSLPELAQKVYVGAQDPLNDVSAQGFFLDGDVDEVRLVKGYVEHVIDFPPPSIPQSDPTA